MKKVNILVVDDRPEGILAVQAVLNSPSYNLVTASSGNEALKHLLNEDFAVILLDVQMPIMNGFETASIIKTREKSKDIPIIFMSAINQDEQYVYQGYGVGAIDYLLKPFDPYILRSKVAIFVDIYRKNELIKEQALKLRETEAKAHAQEMDRLEIENLRRYQYLADAIPQIVFRLLPDGKYEYFNKGWFDYTGLNLNNSFGFSWNEVIHPDDLSLLMNLFNPDENIEGKECECRILNREGQFRWHLIRVQPERYFQHEIVNSWLGTATDIEDRKQKEEEQKFLSEAGELLVSTLDYRKTIKSVSDLIVPYLADWCAFDIINDDGELETIAVSYKDEKIASLSEKFHQKFLYNPDKKFDAIKNCETQVMNTINRELVPDIPIEENIEAMSGMVVPLCQNGKVLGAVTLISHDPGKHYKVKDVEFVEELSRRVALAYENSYLYKLSQQAIEIRNDFLSIASHELNTPITSLKLQLQMVRKTLLMHRNGDFPLERFSKSVEASVKQVDRLINLIQILLDVSRIQSGKFTFTFEKVKARDVLNEVVDRHCEVIESADCELQVDSDFDEMVVWDKTRIEQVLTNLIVNAVKYAPGKILLSMHGSDGDVIISVRDFGKGIPAEKLKTIFDRFERATTSESVSGLGLGLFIVKQIVDGHHGKVEVNSDSNGTVFKVTLPKNVEITDYLPAGDLHQDQIH